MSATPVIDLCPEGYSKHLHDNPTAKGWAVSCPNMKGVPGDCDMDAEHYECKVCGRTTVLYYDEMR